jgi:hypothetical protein
MLGCSRRGGAGFDNACICKENVDLSFCLRNHFVKTIEVFELCHIALNRGNAVTYLGECLVEFRLTAPCDEDISPFCDKPLRRGKTYPAAAACNDSNLTL